MSRTNIFGWVLITCVCCTVLFVEAAPAPWQDVVSSWTSGIVAPKSQPIYVLVVEDHTKPPTIEERKVVFDPKIAEYLKGKGYHPVRLIDDTPDDEHSEVPAEYVPLIAAAKANGPLPQVVVCNAAKKPLNVSPVTKVDSLLAVLQKYGGK